MEVDVKSFRERQDALDKIEIMKKKEAWLAYEEKSASFIQVVFSFCSQSNVSFRSFKFISKS